MKTEEINTSDLSQIIKKVADESGVSEEEVKNAAIDLLNNCKNGN